MTISELATALNTVYPFAHFAWAKAPNTTYGVYAEDSENRDRGTDQYAMRMTVDLFTKDDSVTPRESVQDVFITAGIPWYLNSTQYEDQTGLIHYEWVVEVFED